MLILAEVGHKALIGFEFELGRPHTICKLCGAVFQTVYDRNPESYVDATYFLNADMVSMYALGLRKEWSHNHAKTHSDWEHQALALSQRWCTPEAAEKLAPFGIIDIAGLALDEEVQQAYRQAHRAPDNDAEGTTNVR